MASPRKKPRNKTQKKREAKRRALPDVLRKIIENPEHVKIGRPSDYSPELGLQIIALMETGLSFTSACGAIGIARSTGYAWIAAHKDFSDSVGIAKAKRVFALESEMLGTDNATVANIRRFALVNAAPDEFREKQTVEHEEGVDSPLRALAKQLMGTAIRPQLPAPTVIDHDANEAPRTIRPQMPVTNEADDHGVTIEAEPVAKAREPEPSEDEEEAPRIHTIPKNYSEDQE